MVWQEVIQGSNVWVYEYVANGYKANAIALSLNENELAIVSPPVGLSEADFTEIDAKGRVKALIAPHSGHDLGQNEWQARYPDAIPYAPTAAIDQLRPIGQRPFTPLSKLSAATVEFREVPGTKKGGTLAIAHHGNRPIVYLDELVSHWTSLPTFWLARFLFWVTGSAPGLKLNRVYLKFLCPDPQAVAQTVLKALEGDPAIVPAHGALLVQSGDAARIRTMVQPLAKSERSNHAFLETEQR